MSPQNQGKNTKTDFKKAYFAGGCFWCLDTGLGSYPGVKEVITGYMNGATKNPTYEQVSSGKTGYKEAVEVHYDPKIISFQQLVEAFWKQIDPTDDGGQFTDRGSQYQTAIFYQTEEERKIAEDSKQKLEESQKFLEPIVTEVLPAKQFWKAEEEHQHYAQKKAFNYILYAEGSGRKRFIKEHWE